PCPATWRIASRRPDSDECAATAPAQRVGGGWWPRPRRALLHSPHHLVAAAIRPGSCGVKTDVWVDGRRWRRVTSFAEARPEDEVFVLDTENGSLQFGDGVTGRRPLVGAEVVVAVYRHGAGSRGDAGSDAPPIEVIRPDVVDTTDPALWTVIRARTSSTSIQ